VVADWLVKVGQTGKKATFQLFLNALVDITKSLKLCTCGMVNHTIKSSQQRDVHHRNGRHRQTLSAATPSRLKLKKAAYGPRLRWDQT